MDRSGTTAEIAEDAEKNEGNSEGWSLEFLISMGFSHSLGELGDLRGQSSSRSGTLQSFCGTALPARRPTLSRTPFSVTLPQFKKARAWEARSVEKSKPAPDIRFVGDLDDPWVVAIAESLPVGTKCVQSAGDLPESAFSPADAEVLVLHRQILTRHDAERLRRFRASKTPAPQVLLCHGPHIRYDDLARWSELVDGLIPDATALETLSRHVGAALGEPGPLASRPSPGLNLRCGVAVISANFALRQTLADAVELLGYRATPAREFPDLKRRGTTLWDVPLLEPGWPAEMARWSRSGPLIALLGFADRAIVTQAREQGAAACLELPVDLADLAMTLDRLSLLPAPFGEAAHQAPPPPAFKRHGKNSRSVADTRRDK